MRRLWFLPFLILPMLLFGSCKRYPNKGRVKDTLHRLESLQPTPRSSAPELLMYVYGHGKFADMSPRKQSSEPLDALAFFTASTGFRGWVVMDTAPIVPRFVPRVDGRVIEHEPFFILGVLASIDAGLGYSITTATGEAPSVGSFFRAGIVEMSPEHFSASNEYQPGQNGNALGWFLVMLAEFGITQVNWENNQGQQLNIAPFLAIALSRPLDWGSTTGLDEHFGVADALYVHRVTVADANILKKGASKQERDPYAITLDGAWAGAQKRIDEVLDAAKKNQAKDGTFGPEWANGGAPKGNAAARARHTARVIAIASVALDDKQLREKWIAGAVRGLCELINDNFEAVSKDPYASGYAAHALRLYRARMPGGTPRKAKICKGRECSPFFSGM